MLNVAYKIASGCIAQRIKAKLPQIISPDETGFMADRFIGDNIRLVYDMVQTRARVQISPQIFLVVSELLAHIIRQDRNIKG